MKLNLQREDLLKPLQVAIGVVERKQTLPILPNVLIKIVNNQIDIIGTDLEVELIGHMPLSAATMTVDGLTLPGRKLMEICRALPEQAPVELSQEKEKIILRSGNSRFALSTLPASEFPNVEASDESFQCTVETKKLKQLLHRTYFAMAQDDVRYYLNGLLLEIMPTGIRAIATDGHRLALDQLELNLPVDKRLSFIVPRKGIIELLRLLSDENETMQLTICSNHLRATTEHFTFTSRLLEGSFPDYERVVPKNGNKVLVIDRDVMKQSMQRVAILCNEKFRGVRFELRHGLLKLLANNPEQEIAEEKLVVTYDQEDLDIGFNIGYLLDVLNVVAPGDLKFTFSGPDSSVLIEEVDQGSKSLFVVMPMRL